MKDVKFTVNLTTPVRAVGHVLKVPVTLVRAAEKYAAEETVKAAVTSDAGQAKLVEMLTLALAAQATGSKETKK